MTLFHLCAFSIFAQYSLTGSYAQQFDNLGTGNIPSVTNGDLGTIHPSLAGWYIMETGSAANTGISAGDGSGVQGDTYHFGAAASTDRALGGLQSGTVLPVIGFWFTNHTGQTITSMVISYTGEQWRLGSPGRTDRMDFQYSQNASGLDNGLWIDIDVLDFTGPITTGSPRALDGNVAGNRVMISISVPGLYLPNDSTFFIRWIDFNASNADDGLAIDDFQLVPGFQSPATGYFRTTSGGEWNQANSWEYSADAVNWSASGYVPTSLAKQIRIRNGHHITFNAFLPVDEVIIEAGGILDHRNGLLNIHDGPGVDAVIEAGGILQLSSASNSPTITAGATIRVASNAILRVSANGLTNIPGAGVHAAHYIYEHESILEYTMSTAFGSVAVTYFPNVNESTIPVFRTTQNIGVSVGSVSPTIINGIFEANGNLTLANSGQKIFRNGIRGVGNINGASSGKFIINGRTAELGGPGNLTVPASAGIEIGSAQGTIVNLSSDKTITGNVSLVNATEDNIIQTQNHKLIVTGTISGGSPGSYVRANMTAGGLTLRNVGPPGKLFPVGDQTYNPITVSTVTGTADFTANVRDGIWDPQVPIPSDAVKRTWYLASGAVSQANLTFQYGNNPGELTGNAIIQPVPMELLQSDGETWHLSTGNYSLNPSTLPGPAYSVTTVQPVGIGTSLSPLSLGRSGTIILPVNLFIDGNVTLKDNKTLLQFVVTLPNAVKQFEIEYSLNGLDFISIALIDAIPTRENYNYTDLISRPGKKWYRVKALVPDSNPIYSPVYFAEEEGTIHGITIYPNPVESIATVKIPAHQNGNAILSIKDIQGKELYRKTIRLTRGMTYHTLSVSSLPRGFYILKVELGDWIRTGMFIKK